MVVATWKFDLNVIVSVIPVRNKLSYDSNLTITLLVFLHKLRRHNPSYNSEISTNVGLGVLDTCNEMNRFPKTSTLILRTPPP